MDVDFLKKPVLIADRIVGGNNDLALLLDLDAEDSAKRSTGGGSSVIVDPALIANATRDLVGRHVDLKNVRVLRMAHGGGFFVDLPGSSMLVLPAMGVPVNVAPGDTVSLIGAMAAAPRRTGDRVQPPAGWNDRVYIVATAVRK